MSGGIQSFEDSIFDSITTGSGDTFEDISPEPVIDDVGREQQPVTPPTRQHENTPDIDADLQRQTQDQKRDAAKPQQGKPEAGKPRTNERGDIVDEKGQVIARAGSERRLHVQNERLRNDHRAATEKVQQLEQELQSNKSFAELPGKLGLTADQVSDAFQLSAQFQKDPVVVIKELMSRALAGGVELRQIIDDEFIPNLSLKATQTLLDQRLKPIEDMGRSQQSERELLQSQEQARNEAVRFMDDFADKGAEVHASDIAQIMQEIATDASRQGRSIDAYSRAEMALERIRAFCFENGLDPMQPIAPQVEARRANPGGTAPVNGRGRTPVTPQSRPRPMPNGNSGRGAASEPVQPFASPDDSFASIVRNSMRENGYDV